MHPQTRSRRSDQMLHPTRGTVRAVNDDIEAWFRNVTYPGKTMPHYTLLLTRLVFATSAVSAAFVKRALDGATCVRVSLKNRQSIRPPGAARPRRLPLPSSSLCALLLLSSSARRTDSERFKNRVCYVRCSPPQPARRLAWRRRRPAQQRAASHPLVSPLHERETITFTFTLTSRNAWGN